MVDLGAGNIVTVNLGAGALADIDLGAGALADIDLGVGVSSSASVDPPSDTTILPGITSYRWNAADIALADATSLESWTDSHSGIVITHSEPTRRPVYYDSVVALGSLPGVLFDGLNDLLYSAASVGSDTPTNLGADFTGGFTAFVVFYPTDNVVYRGPMTIAPESGVPRLVSYGGATYQKYSGGGTGAHNAVTNWNVGADYLLQATPVTVNALNIDTVRIDGSGTYARFHHWQNETDENSGAGAGTGNPCPQTDQPLWFGQGYSWKYQGYICDIILYEGALTATQIGTVRTALNDYWGAW